MPFGQPLVPNPNSGMGTGQGGGGDYGFDKLRQSLSQKKSVKNVGGIVNKIQLGRRQKGLGAPKGLGGVPAMRKIPGAPTF